MVNALNLKDIINQIIYDEFGRPSGIIAVDKPTGRSSHDIVYLARKHYQYKKIGHAGALDKFASGLLLILIGKSTKLASSLLEMDKQYQARVVLGISTETQDIEGKLLAKKQTQFELSEKLCQAIVTHFSGPQKQFVSLYSSVKVNGEKLRIMMRDQAYNKEIKIDGQEKYLIMTSKNNPDFQKIIQIPAKPITISKFEIIAAGQLQLNDYAFYDEEIKAIKGPFSYLDLQIDCSKGTYIRQLAEDIGSFLNLPAALVSLRRTRIADINLSNTITLDSK